MGLVAMNGNSYVIDNCSRKKYSDIGDAYVDYTLKRNLMSLQEDMTSEVFYWAESYDDIKIILDVDDTALLWLKGIYLSIYSSTADSITAYLDIEKSYNRNLFVSMLKSNKGNFNHTMLYAYKKIVNVFLEEVTEKVGLGVFE